MQRRIGCRHTTQIVDAAARNGDVLGDLTVGHCHHTRIPLHQPAARRVSRIADDLAVAHDQRAIVGDARAALIGCVVSDQHIVQRQARKVIDAAGIVVSRMSVLDREVGDGKLCAGHDQHARRMSAVQKRVAEPAPLIVNVLATSTSPMYVPGAMEIVSPSDAFATATVTVRQAVVGERQSFASSPVAASTYQVAARSDRGVGVASACCTNANNAISMLLTLNTIDRIRR